MKHQSTSSHFVVNRLRRVRQKYAICHEPFLFFGSKNSFYTLIKLILTNQKILTVNVKKPFQKQINPGLVTFNSRSSHNRLLQGRYESEKLLASDLSHTLRSDVTALYTKDGRSGSAHTLMIDGSDF